MMNCSEMIEIDYSLIVFEVIFYSPVTFFGGLLNTIALWVFYFRLDKWTETRVYMINLATADYTTIFTLPFIMYFHNYNWPEDTFCQVIIAIYCINMPMSVYTITFIALDRYVAIKHPLKAKGLRSPRKARNICLFLWLCCFLFAILFVFAFPRNKQTFCFYKTSEEDLPHLLGQTVFLFFIPLAVVIFCSTQIISCLKRKKNASLQEQNLAQKAIRVVSVNMGTFIICFLPFNLSLLAGYATDAAGADCWLREAISKTIHVTTCITSLNCCLDVVFYYLAAQEFQEAAFLSPASHSMQSRYTITQDSELQS